MSRAPTAALCCPHAFSENIKLGLVCFSTVASSVWSLNQILVLSVLSPRDPASCLLEPRGPSACTWGHQNPAGTGWPRAAAFLTGTRFTAQLDHPAGCPVGEGLSCFSQLPGDPGGVPGLVAHHSSPHPCPHVAFVPESLRSPPFSPVPGIGAHPKPRALSPREPWLPYICKDPISR